MKDRITHFNNWEYYLSLARENNIDTNNKIWQQAYSRQVVFTELELRSLGTTIDTEPSNIPNINTVQNLNQINPKKELAIVEIIGMPGAGKDTIISHLGKQNVQNLYYTPIEGYEWSQREFPHSDIPTKHIQAYGGLELEIEDIIDDLSYMESPTGSIILNRSFRDNFLAFGYSFFLSGYMDVNDLVMSQKHFHYLQYSPSLVEIKDKLQCVDNISASTIVLMIRPDTSLERKPERGRILNKDFLNILYSQYLRMISRLSTMGQRNLTVLDMGGPREESTKLFQRTIEEIIKI